MWCLVVEIYITPMAPVRKCLTNSLKEMNVIPTFYIFISLPQN